MDQLSWKYKHKSLKDYYDREFDKKYFKFDEYELTVDPDETLEDFNEYTPERQREEIEKCANSFAYFCTKYVKILHPKEGLIPFIQYRYQKRVVERWETCQLTIIRKFRQGGLTTVAEIWGLWRCMFNLDQQIVLLSKTDSEAITAGEIVNNAIKYMPTWLQPTKDGKWNDHQKHFPETGGKMVFGTPERARGLSITYLIVDEAAFIPDMDKYWKAMYPTLSTGGNCIIISTVNGLGNWYEETYHDAENKKNDFVKIDLSYKEHPGYNNEEWVKKQKAQLGDKGWRQEVLGDFLGSGETYIPGYIIGELSEATKHNTPKIKKFRKYVNANDMSESSDEWEEDGALWIWREPIDGHDYLISVDCSEGVGDDGDNSCIEILDNTTLEQVAEFYSNSTPPYVFAQIINEIAILYNHAMVIIESMGTGSAVLSNLQHELYYDNIFYSQSSTKTPKPGVKITPSNRSTILESLQHRLMNKSLRVNSKRFVKELNTFIYNAQTRKTQAQKGKHDDAIMAMALGLYIRDTILREIPMGADVPKEMTQPFHSITYEEIKREIKEIAPENLIDEPYNPLTDFEDESMTIIPVSFKKRRHHAILKEFGWSIIPFILTIFEMMANIL